jgi:putative MATE family efflux protein
MISETQIAQIDPILHGSLNRGIFKLAIPAMVSVVSIMLFEFIDLFWIGRLGAEAVAALGAASFVIWTVKALANCVASGINAILSRTAGARDMPLANLWAAQGLLLTALFSLLMTIPLYFINEGLFALLGLEPAVARMAHDYTFVLIIGIIFIYESVSLDTVFRSMGNTFIPMVIIVISLTLNAVLDPFFIFGWQGFPKMGMAGGAVASLISHIVSLILLSLKLPAISIKLKWQLRAFYRHSLEILRIGAPIGILGAIFSIIYIVLSKNIAYFGTASMAAISTCHRIEGIPYFISFGFSVAVATFVGQNLGNKNPARAEKAVYVSLGYAVLFLAFVSGLFILTGRQILSVFVQDQQVIEAGYAYLFAISVFEIFLGAEVILEGAFTGAGDTKPPFFISIPLTFMRIPLAYLFSIPLGYGVNAIWWVISTSTLFKGTIMLAWFRRGKWKLKKVGEN